MKTTNFPGLSRIWIDQGEAQRTFYVESAIRDKIQRCGLANEFEAEAFKALVFLKDRIDLSDDVWEVELCEMFELPQGPEEGLPSRWSLSYNPHSQTYLAQEI